MPEQETRTSADNSPQVSLQFTEELGNRPVNFRIKAVKLVKRHRIPICIKVYDIPKTHNSHIWNRNHY